MSDLISREALLKVIRDDRLTNASDAIYFITSAPAVSGEAVAWYREMPMEYVGNCIEHINEKGEAVYIDFRMSTPPATKGWIPLYTTPQQTQSVADALEEAAKICDDYANSNFGSLVDSGQNGAYVCSKAIRALIKRNAKEGE